MSFSLKSFRLPKRAPQLREMRFMYPERDWFVGLLVASLIFVVGAGYAGYRFYAAMQITEGGAPVTPARQPYLYEKAATVLSTYEDKNKRFESLRAGAPAPESMEVVEQATTTEVTADEREGDQLAEEAAPPVE